MIRGLGYRVVLAERHTPEEPALRTAVLPADAPGFFRDSFNKARADGRPMLIEFHAAWCAPCKRLKKETLGHPDVISALAGITVIEVDLDAHPGLAGAYGVQTVPDLFFVDRHGRIASRLRKFEPHEPFLKRLGKLEAHSPGQENQAVNKLFATLGVTTRAPTAEEARRHVLPGGVRTQGQVVVDVERGGAADTAGVRTGDVLLKFGRDAIFSRDDLHDFVMASTPGDSIELEIADGETSKRKVTSVELGGKQVEVATEPRLVWDLAGLAQLEDALERAEREHKLVLVGLSGADT